MEGWMAVGQDSWNQNVILQCTSVYFVLLVVFPFESFGCPTAPVHVQRRRRFLRRRRWRGRVTGLIGVTGVHTLPAFICSQEYPFLTNELYPDELLAP